MLVTLTYLIFFGDDGLVLGDEDEGFDDDVGLGGDGNPIPANVEVAGDKWWASEPSVLSSVAGNNSAGTTNKKTRTNLLVSAVEDLTLGTAAAMSSIMQQHQLSEEAEWRFKRMEWEDERKRREEEKEEIRRKREEAEEERRHEWEEDHSRREEELHQQQLRDSCQQEHVDWMMQLAISGLFTYMGMKLPNKDNDENEE